MKMAMSDNIIQIRTEYLQRLKRRSPKAFDYALQKFATVRGMSGLGQTDETATGAEAVASDSFTFDSFLQTLKDLVPVYTSYQLSQDLYQLNLERVRQGLPPVDAQSVSPQVNVGLSSDMRMLLMVGGGALLAVLLFGQMRRR
jgi:hypothetical protein